MKGEYSDQPGAAFVMHHFKGTWKKDYEQRQAEQLLLPPAGYPGALSHDRWGFAPLAPRPIPAVADLPGSCNYTTVKGSILRGYAGGIAVGFHNFSTAAAFCERFGAGCGGVTRQEGRYEARRSDWPEAEANARSLKSRRVTRFFTLLSSPWTCTTGRRGRILPETVPGKRGGKGGATVWLPGPGGGDS